MSLFENQNCPVCKRQFEDGDDIVVCPECGTPHHRECYNLIGHCVNRGLHKSDYNYYNEHPQPKKENGHEERQSFFPPKDENGSESRKGFVPPVFGGAPSSAPFSVNPFETTDEKINGESLADVAAYVRNNQLRFINIFRRQEQTGKKTGWNWGAFFFGQYYFFFRKMYKQAIILLCAGLTISCLFTLLTGKYAPETIKAIADLQTLKSTDMTVFFEKLAAIQKVADYSTYSAIAYSAGAAGLLLRIVFAIFADSMYKTEATQLIKRVNQKISEGAEFNTPYDNSDELRTLSREQLKRLFLAKKGGITIWAPLMAYFATELLMTLIQK